MHTANLSNLGVVNLPQSFKTYVEDFFFVLGTSFSCKNHMAVISYNEYINITFSREIVENNLEKMFFNELTKQGLDIEIISNYWEDEL